MRAGASAGAGAGQIRDPKRAGESPVMLWPCDSGGQGWTIVARTRFGTRCWLAPAPALAPARFSVWG
jgi:hypothetical protein